jgi:hypothetical protein
VRPGLYCDSVVVIAPFGHICLSDGKEVAVKLSNESRVTFLVCFELIGDIIVWVYCVWVNAHARPTTNVSTRASAVMSAFAGRPVGPKRAVTIVGHI